jgi:hypothetical protein
MGEIRCGNRKHTETTYHIDIEDVRACFAHSETWACTWLVAFSLDGETHTRDCGAVSWNLAEGRGYACTNGHEHIYCDVRAAEGWDYAADPDEAGLLAGRGVRPVAMDGTGIEVNQAAMAYAASL